MLKLQLTENTEYARFNSKTIEQFKGTKHLQYTIQKHLIVVMCCILLLHILWSGLQVSQIGFCLTASISL